MPLKRECVGMLDQMRPSQPLPQFVRFLFPPF